MKSYRSTTRASFYRKDDGEQEISIDIMNSRIIDIILEALKADTFKAAEDGKYAEVVENAEYFNDITEMYSNWDKGKGATTNE